MRKILFVVFAMLLAVEGFAQRTIQGKVTDESGQGVPDVSVVVKGTTTGTSSLSDGRFTLTIPENATTLVFSAVGYQTQEVSITGANSYDVTLLSAVSDLDEVVMIAYGSVKRSDFTGSAAQVSGKSLENRPISNALNALIGAAPGIQTTLPSGAPGSSPGIIVRGFGSYSISSSPLYVVDGAIYDGGFSNIIPEDIESITVLKDASTTALYGSRGANGVVMITTKKGKKGKQALQFKAQTGWSNPGIPPYETVNAYEYYPLAWESYRNSLVYDPDLLAPIDSASMIASGLLPRFTSGANAGRQNFRGGNYRDIYQMLGNYNPFNVGNTEIVGVDGKLNPNASLLYPEDLNWLDQSTRTGRRNEYTLQYSAGTGNTDLNSSFSYLDEEGWGLRSSLKRFTGRVNVNVNPTTWFKTGLNIGANRSTFNNAATSGIVNPFYFSRYIAPIFPVHLHDPVTGAYVLDALGEKQFDFGNEGGYSRPYNTGRHTIAEHLWNLDDYVRDALSARGYAEVKFTDWLTFTTNISMDVTSTDGREYQNPRVGDGYPAGRFSRYSSKVTSYTFNQLLNFNKQISGVHTLDFLLGHENYDYNSAGIDGMRIGQSFDGIYVYSNFGTINSLTSSLTYSRTEGYFSRLNYDYNNKYLISLSMRRDGNSKFPSQLRWENFWSVGIGWRVDREDFFQLPWVNMLKFRASYGYAGNSNGLGNFPYQAGYSIGYDNDVYPGVYLTSLGSPHLTWETQKPLDVGIDFSVLNNRLWGTIEYFYRNSSGLIFSVPQPFQNGGTTGGPFTVSQNVGSMNNKGIEVQITGNIMRKPNFNWNLTLNATSYKNKITKMPDETPALTSSPFKREVGRSIYDFYTRTFYGIDPDDGQVLYLGALTYNAATTRIIGKDTVTIDHNNAPQTYVGKSSIPDVYGSIVNNLSYKNFELSFVLTYQLGGYIYDGVYGSLMSTEVSGRTYHVDIKKRWQKPGDKTDVPRLDLLRSAQFGAASTRWLTSATYLSINNVSLSYRLPSSVTSSIGANNVRVFVSGENLHFFTKRKGMNVNGAFSGTTGDTYDVARVINAGISVNF
jgi:TonB-linked SusC/RagA family outer membrane protein